jgi:hypothetical protein
LHPDVVAPYEYIFVWDEDLGLDNFDADLWVSKIIWMLEKKKNNPFSFES